MFNNIYKANHMNKFLYLFCVLLLVSCSKDEIKIVSEPTFHTADIQLFWEVFDHASSQYTASVFQEQYIDRGSEGLKDYATQKDLATSLPQTLSSASYLAYYTSIRQNTIDLSEETGRISGRYGVLHWLQDYRGIL